MDFLVHLARLDVPDIHPGGASATAQLLRAIAPRRGQRFLELGCGTGKTLRRLARRRDVDVVGVDMLDEMLAAARRRVGAASGCWSLVRANASQLPFVESSFDAVYAESAIGIHTSAEIRRILSEAYRVLKPGGAFVVNEAIWRPHIDKETVAAINARSIASFGLRPASADAWHLEEWEQEIRSAGFTAISAKPIAAPALPYRVLAKLENLRRGLQKILSRELRSTDKQFRQSMREQQRADSTMEARLFVSRRPD